MKSSCRFLIVVFVFAIVLPASAQSLSSSIDPFGRIFSARIRPERPVAPAAADAEAAAEPEERTSFMLVALGAGDSASSSNGNLSVGYITQVNKRDLFVQGKYSYVDNDRGGSANRVTAVAQYGIVPDGPFPMALVAFGAYDPNLFQMAGAALAVERSLVKDKLTATGNLQWATLDVDGAGSVSDLQPGVGIELRPSAAWTFGVDYTFDNDIDGEDTGSVTISRGFKAGRKLKLGVEKHKVFALTFSQLF